MLLYSPCIEGLSRFHICAEVVVVSLRCVKHCLHCFKARVADSACGHTVTLVGVIGIGDNRQRSGKSVVLVVRLDIILNIKYRYV